MVNKHRKKIIIELAVFCLFGILVVWLYFADFSQGAKMDYGVTFSSKYTQELGLNWPSVYLEILNDLKVRDFRLVLYWDEAEKERGVYDWSGLDWQLDELAKVNGRAIVALGERVPRWPECHTPAWANNLSREEKQVALNNFVEQAVNHYKNQPAIISWQVENEPFLNSFGICQDLDKTAFRKEVATVRANDTRPIVITESGELSTWLGGGIIGDQVGTSVYRVVWNKTVGYFYYPLPPAYYYLKAKLINFLTGEAKFFVSEMQMEPWSEGQLVIFLPLEKQLQGMDVVKFKNNLEYSKRVGLGPVYLWGVEWWYWLKEKENDSSLWNTAQEIWR